MLAEAGHDAVHTSELPNGNQTTDAEITRRADDEDRVVVTKDQAFRDSHLLRSVPRRLLVIATGNVTKDDICRSSIGTTTPSWTRSKRHRSSSSRPTGSSSANAEVVLRTG
ncbi:MAG: DUF5615 family PIN-like protein [Actinobacteria bacterium]|nr:DUF5615 family PIN-like protein [Actinomycetota bacterium]